MNPLLAALIPNEDYTLATAPGYGELHQLAWTEQNRGVLFKRVVDEQGSLILDPKGDPYSSLSILFRVNENTPSRILITNEYKTALEDAIAWFDGFHVPPTSFGPEDSEWNQFQKNETETDVTPRHPHNPFAQKGFIVLGAPGTGQSI
ncbi:hypothetical protein C8Q75DRAFT_725772 [Abortiporus biennis]|nr:hypothetical protein C8Q75DRAFT_725772 [Abortiporus biennis]